MPPASGEDARWHERGPTARTSLYLRTLEGRAPLEAMTSLALWPLLVAGPRGDGHSVLVLPGLLASDDSTEMLRAYLCQRGFDAVGWGHGDNLGPRPGVIEACLNSLRRLQQRSGRKVSLIGQSLGGVYARLLAAMARDSVRLVVSLGSPLAGPASASHARRIYDTVSGPRSRDERLRELLRQPPRVPTSSIYSRSDGVVAWQSSVRPAQPQLENIEVQASHIGMAMHPAVLHAVADRLAQPEGQWAPFQRHGIRQWIYGDTQRRR
jgi:pimeloyl-ACP methyl ester carboxylesterase